MGYFPEDLLEIFPKKGDLMDTIDNDKKIDAIPEIYSAITFFFEKNVDVDMILNELKGLGICDTEVIGVSIHFAIIYYERIWYLDDALTKMFSKVDGCLPQLKDILVRHKGRAIIDIAFYQYGTYPALEFCGENMKKIRFLEADISIDPYDLSEDDN
jgi:hypothetical protein